MAKWNFGPNNASERRRRALTASELESGTTTGGGAPYQLSRSAMREQYGARAIDASAPHSSRDTMTNLTPTGVSGGFSDSGAWGRMFRPSLGSGFTDPKAVTGIGGGSSLFDPKVPFTAGGAPVTPTSMFGAAIDENEKWFNQRGLSIPDGAMRRYGDKFTSSKYGGGGSVHPQIDWQRKLALLGLDDDVF